MEDENRKIRIKGIRLLWAGILAASVIGSGFAAAAYTGPDLGALTPEEQRAQKTEEILNRLTPEEKAAQLFFVTPEALTGEKTVTETSAAMQAALDKYPVGGIIYFAKNLTGPEQTRDMLEGVQAYVSQTQALPVFLGVDEEGGRVLRIGANSAFGVERVKPMGVLATQGSTAPIYDAGSTIGAYLEELGFNVDFAPDADVITNAKNRVIGDRSFGTDPDTVAEMAWAYSEGLHDRKILACYKHFPGHGGTVEDSHSDYAYSYKTLDELRAAELVPFQMGCDKGVDFIMAAHISVPNVTGGDVPACLSEVFITEVLRTEMEYGGIIITDSLSMGAICEHYDSGEAAVLALQAGCDMLLMPENFSAAYDAVLEALADGTLDMADIDASVARIIDAKLRLLELQEAGG